MRRVANLPVVYLISISGATPLLRISHQGVQLHACCADYTATDLTRMSSMFCACHDGRKFLPRSGPRRIQSFNDCETHRVGPSPAKRYGIKAELRLLACVYVLLNPECVYLSIPL